MAKYYCEYCKSYLTHDSLSVRKSHLIGRNHLRKYCDYYEEKAKELGIWDSNDLPYEITESDLYANIPGRAMSLETPLETFPPPPSLPNLPNPPPAIYHYNTTEEKELISSVMREYQHRNTVK